MATEQKLNSTWLSTRRKHKDNSMLARRVARGGRKLIELENGEKLDGEWRCDKTEAVEVG